MRGRFSSSTMILRSREQSIQLVVFGEHGEAQRRSTARGAADFGEQLFDEMRPQPHRAMARVGDRFIAALPADQRWRARGGERGRSVALDAFGEHFEQRRVRDRDEAGRQLVDETAERVGRLGAEMVGRLGTTDAGGGLAAKSIPALAYKHSQLRRTRPRAWFRHASMVAYATVASTIRRRDVEASST